MKQIAAREAVGLLRTMTWVLCAVGLLALVFTTVNVTRFATSRDVPLPIAILLDPMIGTALAGVLYVDARLAAWSISPPAWSTTLRWSAGCTAALMNSWESLWPDGQIGWPRQADPAAVLLHLTPALLLIALTETIAAYRRTVTELLHRVGPTDQTEQPAPFPATAHRSDPEATAYDRSGPLDDPDNSRSARPGSPTPVSTPDNAFRPLNRQTTRRGTPGDDVRSRAIALNEAALASTGKPVSIWRLRTDLHVGPRRALQIREQLQARPSEPPSRES